MGIELKMPALSPTMEQGTLAKWLKQEGDRIEPGEWQLRALDNSVPVRRLCIDDAYDLVQLRHPGAPCSRFVLSNEPQTATVHYTCPGAGYGRTTIRVETGQLVRVESQGLVNRSPFQIVLEGRRVGKCAPEAATR